METGRAEIQAILCRAGLASLGPACTLSPLEGGVSSDIFRADLDAGRVCVKRARSHLKVKAEWRAPVIRSLFEASWYEIANAIAPNAAPKVVHFDISANAIVMEYLDPSDHPVWKTMLRDGVVDPDTARRLGSIIGRIHAATAGRRDVQKLFPTDRIFYAIRIEPYLLATAARHQDLERPLHRLARQTAETRLALVHGDVSPKNIVIGPQGPVVLDAECAWFGDPAFDLAFCLNHFLLKCAWRPQHGRAYLSLFDAMYDGYRPHVSWEDSDAFEARAARLLPALFLARVDGKSPVEYITDELIRNQIRRVARPLIASPADRLSDVRAAWSRELRLDERDDHNDGSGQTDLGQSGTADGRS